MFSEANELVVDVTLVNYDTQEYRLWVNFKGIVKDTGNAYYGMEGLKQAEKDARTIFTVLNGIAPYFELQN